MGLVRFVHGPTAGVRMSLEALAEVLARAGEDELFRARLLRDPAAALAGYDLTPEETRALLDGDLREILSRGS